MLPIYDECDCPDCGQRASGELEDIKTVPETPEGCLWVTDGHLMDFRHISWHVGEVPEVCPYCLSRIYTYDQNKAGERESFCYDCQMPWKSKNHVDETPEGCLFITDGVEPV